MKNSWNKAGAYMGLAFIPAVAGWLGYQIGLAIDRQTGFRYGNLIGMLLGLAAGFYELLRHADRIEKS
jgi:F0F1-type ATP synthase assembly protein I